MAIRVGEINSTSWLLLGGISSDGEQAGNDTQKTAAIALYRKKRFTPVKHRLHAENTDSIRPSWFQFHAK
ncbi:hypothetical protein ACFLYW_04100 [Thermodesulfobacteriota bacterium]